MVLVFSDYQPSDLDTIRRNTAAMETWLRSGMRLHPYKSEDGQDSRAIGDAGAFPFISDMLASAFASGDDWIAVLANNDIRIGDGLPWIIQDSCNKHGCYWARRVDDGGNADDGSDLFAMTRVWYGIYGALIPDCLLGCRGWDMILRDIMVYSGCPEGPREYFHTPHGSNNHMSRLHTPAARYNQAVWEKWQKERASILV